MSTLGYDLHVLVGRLDRAADRLLQPHGLTYRRYVTLLVMGEVEGGTQRKVAESLGISDAAVSRMATALVGDGLITLHQERGNGHRKAVSLTTAGRRLLDAATATLGSSLDDLVRSVGVDPDTLAHDLRVIRDGVEA